MLLQIFIQIDTISDISATDFENFREQCFLKFRLPLVKSFKFNYFPEYFRRIVITKTIVRKPIFIKATRPLYNLYDLQTN